MLCICPGGDYVVVVSLCIAALNVCTGWALCLAVIAFLLFHCLLLLPLCV